MKIVATARGGWDVNPASYEWQFEQARDGHGILTFDHGWHQLAVAHWLFGPIRRVFGWIRAHRDRGGIVLDAPATFVWEHHNGVRAVLDIVLAADMYFRSDYYADDERVEVTGTTRLRRAATASAAAASRSRRSSCTATARCTAYHALADEPPDAFAASAAHGIDCFRTGAGDLLIDGRHRARGARLAARRPRVLGAGQAGGHRLTAAEVEIRVSEVEPSPTAVVAGPLDLSRFMADLDTVYEFLRSDTRVRQTGHNIALYAHGERMEVGVEVDSTFDTQGPVTPSRLPGGRIAHATHTTGYADLGVTYAAITRWCATNGHRSAGVQWERYGDPDERDHVDVEVCFLLA